MTTGAGKWPRLHSRRLLAVILTGALLSVYAAHAVRSYESEKRRIQFENTAGGYSALIKFAFRTRLEEIGALGRFFESSSFVSPEEFRLFIEPLVSGGATASAIEWIPRVDADKRPAFEAQMRSGGSSGGEISAYDARGTLVRAPDRDIHFPIRYAEPEEKNRSAVGLDLSSDAVSFKAMEKARDTGRPVMIPQIRFLQQQDSYEFRILCPVYRGGPLDATARGSSLMGFVAGRYRCADIVETALSPVPPAGIDVTVSDSADPQAPRPLYVHPSRPRSGELPYAQEASAASMRYRASFSLADRSLAVTCLAGPGFSGSGANWFAWAVLCGGLMLTGLLSVHMNFLMERNRRITSLVKARTDELHESRTRLELALSGADLGYWDWQVQTGEMTFSRRWAEMVGYMGEDLSPSVRTWRRMMHPEDRKKVIDALRRHLEGLSPRFEAEYRLRHRDGHYTWVLSRGRVIEWDASGKALRACGTHLDVTARKLANQARDLLTAAVEQFGEALIITDPKGRVQYVNSAYERTTGYTRAEVIGEFIHRLPGNGLDGEVFSGIGETLAAGNTWQGMIDSRKKDGSIYYENATISPVFDEDGHIVHHVAVRHDLTDLKRLEEEKQKIEMQYQQSQKLESIGRLAGGVAHDLNNMLGPILGYAEMIMESTDPDDDRFEGLAVIRKSALRARDTVRQLLAFSRKQSLSVRNIDLSALVEDFRGLLRRSLPENIRIEYNLRGPFIINADVGQLEQVLLNLAINAQDAMPDGGLLVIETDATELDASFIETRSGDSAVRPGRYAMLQVSDTGHGMDSSILDYIFEPFFSTKDKSRGTGLGLSMVYGTVKQHGGYIWVYSEPGRGASFKLYFPLLDAPADMPQAPETEPEAPVAGGETIMVVEDDPNIRRMTLQMLTRRGYDVMAAGSGTECLEILESSDARIDVLLTDVIMPDMNGRELYTRVAERLPDVKVIYMSGYTDDIIGHQGVLGGEAPFIQKPFSVRDVVSLIRSVMDGGGEGKANG